MANFGALTDHFGILAITSGAGVLGDVLKLVDSPKTYPADTRTNATDENGDIAASSFHGAGTLEEVSSTFAVVSGSFSTAVLKLGETAANKTVTAININSSNTAFPQLTVTGVLNTETMNTTPKNTFVMPTFTITGCKQAQLIGFTVAAGTKLNSATIDASITLVQQEDGLGEPAAHAVEGGEYTVTAEIVRITAAPAWTVSGVGMTETQVPGESEPQAAYHTGTGVASGTLTRET